MTDEKKKELLRNKFQVIMQEAFKKNQQGQVGEGEFIKFYNAVKNNHAFFRELAKEEKVTRQQQNIKLQSIIAVNEAKISELESDTQEDEK